jgi:hypothetical protein
MSSDNTTVGGPEDLPCPWCKREHEFTDWLIDGWQGGQIRCEGCNKAFDVDVEYSVTLVATKLKEDA